MRRKLLLLSLVVFFGISNAQVVHELGFTPSGVVMSDTANLYSAYDMEFSIVNNGSSTISDPIDIFAVVNDTVSGVSQTPRWLGGVSNIVLNPSDTFHFSIGVIYDNVTPQNAYGPGDNIVVIWPKADVPVSQSTQYFYNNLYVLNTSTVQEVGHHEESSVVKLSESQILIEINDFKEVQVYTIEGKLLWVSKNKSIMIDDWVSGTYIVTVLSQEGKAHSNRIVVE